MALPEVSLYYNSTLNDIELDVTSSGTYYPVNDTISGVDYNGVIVFTGGGIDVVNDGDPVGTRSATVKPDSGFLVVPLTFVEQDVMHQVPLAGIHDNRYVFAVKVTGTTTSNVYLEAWDDTTHTTTDLPVLSGTLGNGHKSMIHAITTTYTSPGDLWDGTCIRGYTDRIELSNSTSVSDSILYFNVYVKIPYDSPTFINTPVLSLRYLYS